MLVIRIEGAESNAFHEAVAVVRGLEALGSLRLVVAVTAGPLRITVTAGPTTQRCTTVEDLLACLRQQIHWTPPPAVGGDAIRIFVAGDKSQVGKSTTCLALLGALLLLGYQPHELAYIKPATQCEAPQMISAFCAHHGITAVPIGPVVFYTGFTRAFLDQPDQAAASAALLAQIAAAVRDVAAGKRVVLVDGVGYPAVGSICGVSNADVAAALRPISVLLVGKPGVGDAVDSFNLNASYFASAGVRVLGAVFNKLPAEGYYCLANCERSVRQYFRHHASRRHKAYGFVPEFVVPTGADAVATYDAIVANFAAAVNVQEIVDDALRAIGTIKRGLEPLPVAEPAAKKARPLTIAFAPREAVQAQAAQDGAVRSS
ncbi:hypothetical protein ACHHYP_13222 [Achlya hypogyna]|uniref:Uncharacterized protein n=1 Tax=Achlya hypogyna TaxID=1202772 RepID=A0A1V9ZFR3_ACHHY|nr:hypothetical protein ACHHYP_13222 [Achlya hypogyna]